MSQHDQYKLQYMTLSLLNNFLITYGISRKYAVQCMSPRR